MEYKDLSTDIIKNALEECLYVPASRKVKMYTNAYGMDAFEEAMMDNVYGGRYKRIYIGKKVARWIRKAPVEIGKSHYTDRWFRVIKTK